MNHKGDKIMADEKTDISEFMERIAKGDKNKAKKILMEILKKKAKRRLVQEIESK